MTPSENTIRRYAGCAGRLVAGIEKAGMLHEVLADYYGMKRLKKYVAERDWWSSPIPS